MVLQTIRKLFMIKKRSLYENEALNNMTSIEYKTPSVIFYVNCVLRKEYLRYTTYIFINLPNIIDHY